MVLVQRPNGFIPADMLLHIAALLDDVEVMTILVEKYNAHIDSDVALGSPLHSAARNGRSEMVRILVERFHADVNKPGFRNWTPLHCAAFGGHANAIWQIKGFTGVDIEAKAIDSWTPLHLAAANGHLEAVQALVQAGASVNARITEFDESYGGTPLFLARKMK